MTSCLIMFMRVFGTDHLVLVNQLLGSSLGKAVSPFLGILQLPTVLCAGVPFCVLACLLMLSSLAHV